MAKKHGRRIPSPRRKPPAPTPRTRCDQIMENDKRCRETDTTIVPAFGRRDHDSSKLRQQWRFCAEHREIYLCNLIGGAEHAWALRQIIREELERIAKRIVNETRAGLLGR